MNISEHPRKSIKITLKTGLFLARLGRVLWVFLEDRYKYGAVRTSARVATYPGCDKFHD